jgi:hypothetical protein
MITYTSQLSTTTSLFTSMLGDVTSTVGFVIAGVLGVAIFILGVGYGFKKLKKYALGKGF